MDIIKQTKYISELSVTQKRFSSKLLCSHRDRTVPSKTAEPLYLPRLPFPPKASACSPVAGRPESALTLHKKLTLGVDIDYQMPKQSSSSELALAAGRSVVTGVGAAHNKIPSTHPLVAAAALRCGA